MENSDQRVREEDRYTANDYRQVFDLLRYLSFPLEDDPDVCSGVF